MATRPCFRPLENAVGYKAVDFGDDRPQKNVAARHGAIAKSDPPVKVLEISRTSSQPLGVSLSTLDLRMDLGGTWCTVESVFQASQVFAGGVGPFPNLCSQDASDVALFVDDEVGESPVVAFEHAGERWAAHARTAFFFNLYLKALRDNPGLAEGLMEYDAFADAGFAPWNRTVGPAAAAAFYVSLRRQGVLEWAMKSQENFLCVCR